MRWFMSLLFVAQMYLAMPLVGLLYLPYALVSREGARAACKFYSRWVFWTARMMVGIRTEVRGEVPDGEVLVASKHQSFLDVMMVFNALPTAKFIMKREMLWMPVIGQYAVRLGCIPVHRGKKGAAIRKMLDDVDTGSNVPGQLIIYPQGTRVPPGEMRPYKKGTAAIYEATNEPCVPVACNVGLFWPRKGIMRKPGLAVVEFLPVIEPGLDPEQMLERLETSVEQASNKLMKEAGFDPETHGQA